LALRVAMASIYAWHQTHHSLTFPLFPLFLKTNNGRGGKWRVVVVVVDEGAKEANLE
jgi:hypothetical protein